MSHTLIMLAIIYTWNTNNVLFELIALMWKRGNGTNSESDQARKQDRALYLHNTMQKNKKKTQQIYLDIFKNALKSTVTMCLT